MGLVVAHSGDTSGDAEVTERLKQTDGQRLILNNPQYISTGVVKKIKLLV